MLFTVGQSKTEKQKNCFENCCRAKQRTLFVKVTYGSEFEIIKCDADCNMDDVVDGIRHKFDIKCSTEI